MKINFKKLIGLAIVVAGSYKIGESIGKLKGSVDSMKFVLKNHPELEELTVKAGDSWVTVNFEGKNDEEKPDEKVVFDRDFVVSEPEFVDA